MMIRALWSGASGMQAQQFNIDTIANDLTNVNTNGYKKTHVNFQDLFYQNLRAAGLETAGGTTTPTGIQVGHGVRVAGTTPIFTQGAAVETGIATNMMISDSGNVAHSFFGVDTGNGEIAYTRDGSFRVNSDGNLTTTDGYEIYPSVGSIPTDAVEINITSTGLVQYRMDEESDMETAGQVQLYIFQNPAGLNPMGSNLWAETDASGQANAGNPGDVGYGTVEGGWLETSNVDAITEMVNLISSQRAYEFNSRSIQTSDEMLQTVNGLKR